MLAIFSHAGDQALSSRITPKITMREVVSAQTLCQGYGRSSAAKPALTEHSIMCTEVRDSCSTTLVNRLRELGEIRAAIDQAMGGQGTLIILAGDPGIGKTRLADEAAHYASLKGARVLSGRCLEGGGAPPYWP